MVRHQRLVALLSAGAVGGIVSNGRSVYAFSVVDYAVPTRCTGRLGVSLCSIDGDSTKPASASLIQQKRKQRTNKYQSFSKVDDRFDPQEKLIAESKQLNQAILMNLVEAKGTSLSELEIDVLPNIEFPDTKDIDPYDPQTFGYIEIGSVLGAHGVHGWLKVRSTTDFPTERLCTAGVRHVKAANKRAPRQVVLLQGKPCFGDEYLVQLEQVDNRDSAQKFRGALLYIRIEQKDTAETSPDEYLVSDLVGMEVFLEPQNDDKQYVGIVGGVAFAEDFCSIPGLGHDYLEIVLPRGVAGARSLRDEMVLIPLVPQLVPLVDVKGGRIYINPPDGLLDLSYVREDKTRIKGFLPPARCVDS